VRLLSILKEVSMIYSRLLALTTLVSCAAGLALAQTAATTTRTLNFPPVGLAITETARINLTNTATASSSGTAASCTGSASFVSAAGAIIGTATPFTIASGVTSSVSLPFTSSGLSARGAIRGVVQVTRSTTAPTPCSLLISVETFDTASGVTHTLLTGADEIGGGPEGGRP
jgi:hypothetical protein